jgi:regulator of protease activity HflC (stomatin/prohibitin superfamily)
MQSITDELKLQRIVTRDTTPFEIRSVLVYKVVDALKAVTCVHDLDFPSGKRQKLLRNRFLGNIILMIL